jgi:hypothetical protein
LTVSILPDLSITIKLHRQFNVRLYPYASSLLDKTP